MAEALKAGKAALERDKAERTRTMQEFREKVVLLTSGLNRIDGFRTLDPTATFYVFPNVAPVCNRLGITSHGLALNRDPDLDWFALMTACGAPGVAATSIAAEGGDPDRDRVDGALAASMAASLGLHLEEATLDDVLPGVHAT